MLDVVIKGGEVVDGTGAPRRRADVGIKDDRVVALGARPWLREGAFIGGVDLEGAPLESDAATGQEAQR